MQDCAPMAREMSSMDEENDLSDEEVEAMWDAGTPVDVAKSPHAATATNSIQAFVVVTPLALASSSAMRRFPEDVSGSRSSSVSTASV